MVTPAAETSSSAPPFLCPSAPCEEGALVLGVVGADARAGFLPRPLVVDAAFVAAAQKGRSPERRLRFAAPCRESDCRQWSDGGCGVIGRVMDLLQVPEAPLPACAVRGQCRWWAQEGRQACAVCRHVVTDLTEEATT